MAIVIARDKPLPTELPEPNPKDRADLLGMRIGVPFHIPLFKYFGMATQTGTIWLGSWGLLSVITFILGNFVLIWAGLTLVDGNLFLFAKYFANLQELPPDHLGLATDLRHGGFWELNLSLWVVSVAAWGMRCRERLARFGMRPFLFWTFAAAVLLTTVIWVIRPILMGTWAEAPGLGLNVDLDWAQNFSVLWGNLYYNPWHELAIFFLFGSVMLWGMHGATILATAAEGSHMEDAEIKDMHSGSHKGMLFWRWTMGFNANPKTIHDWLLWFSAGTVLASAIGILTTGTVVQDWYVWAVDHGWVQQYGPMTRDAVNERPQEFPGAVSGDFAGLSSIGIGLGQYRHVTLGGVTFTGGATLAPTAKTALTAVAQVLDADPTVKIEIDGNTDREKDDAADQRLSLQQANAVRTALITTYHIAPSRLTAVGYGDTRPIVQGDDAAAAATNDRIEIVKVGGS